MSGADVQLEVVEPPRRRRWWRHLVVHLVLAPVILLIAVLVYSWNEGRHVARQLDEIRARGEPVTAADLAAFHRQPPPERDATQLWIDAGNQLAVAFSAIPEDRSQAWAAIKEIPPPGHEWIELPRVEDFLKKNSLAMDKLHLAVRRGGEAKFPIDYSKGIDVRLPDTNNTRVSRRALALEALVGAHRNDPLRTAESLVGALTVSRSLAYEPLFISQLIRAHTQFDTIALVRNLLFVVPFDDSDLSRIQDGLLDEDFQVGYQMAFRGERVMLLLAIEELSQGAPYYQYLLRKSDERCTLELWQDAITISDLPWHEQRAALDVFFGSFESRVGKYHLAARMFPATHSIYGILARATAAGRVVGLGIAAERYRKKHGRPPALLADLVPEFVERIPVDPFTGQALHYKADDAGYTVYSLGGVPAEQRADLPIDAETGGLAELVFRYPPKPWEPPKVDPQFDNPFDVELEPSIETEVDPERASQPSPPESTDQGTESNRPRADGGTPDPETSP